MSRVQIGIGQNLSDWLRRLTQARDLGQRLAVLRKLRPSDIRLFVPEVKNRVTGRSMGEHTEDMAKTWNIGRREQDEFALESHQRAIAAREFRVPVFCFVCRAVILEIEAQGELRDAGRFLTGEVGDYAEG